MSEAVLPDSAFIVLALLAEREAHGYEIQRLAHERGFRFWTRLQRSSIYNALALLERERLIVARAVSAAGPERRVYRATPKGVERLRREGLMHLSSASHPRSEIDLGIYVLPFLTTEQSTDAIAKALAALRGREGFLAERLEWCRALSLDLPALAFERPLLALRAEIAWLERVESELPKLKKRIDVEPQWARYEYKEPPGSSEPSSEPKPVRRKATGKRAKKAR